MNQESRTTNEPRLDGLLEAVRRRLLGRKLAAVASRNLLIALLLVLPAAVFSAFRASPHLPAAAAALCGLGVVIALAEAAARRPTRLDAALHVDRHFNLNERLSTVVSVGAADASQGMYAALLDDTLTHVRNIQAGIACPVSFPRSAPFTGIALFCVAALIFGAAQQGSAGRQLTVSNELDPMLTMAVYVDVELPADLQEELGKISGPSDDIDETLARLDSLLSAFDALEGVTASVQGLGLQDVTAENIGSVLESAPEARTQLEAALERAAEELQSNEDLAQAVRDAQAALAKGTEGELADAVEKLISKLAAATAQHQFDKLATLKERLTMAKESAARSENGVTRALTSGGSVDKTSGGAVPMRLFPKDATLRARAAVRSGQVPARYRWVVEKYFRDGSVE